MSRLLITLFISLLSLPAWGELTVSLLTIDPGKEIYELEGHTELRFNDPERDLDMSVSWGIFDFNSPGFVYRFVKGETDYLTVGYPYSYFLTRGFMSERRVTSQKLNLTEAEAKQLLKLVEINLKPENYIYRYNYVKDNCATRPLHLIEQAIGGELKVDSNSTTTTWRKEMTKYHANYPWYQFGIDLALGSGIDMPINARQSCYAPVYLRQFIDRATRPDGSPIAAEPPVEIITGTPDGLPCQPTPWYLTPMFVAGMLLLITCLSAWRDLKRHKVSRPYFTLLYGIATLEGLVLTYLIFVSTHEATSPNWLYLWLNPFCLLGAIGVWLKKHNRVIYLYQIVNFVALMALIIIGLTGVQQLNVAFYPLIACYLITSAEYLYLNKCQADCIKK